MQLGVRWFSDPHFLNWCSGVWVPIHQLHPQLGALWNIDPLLSVEEALAMLGLAGLAKEWIEVEKDLSGCKTGPHKPTRPE